MKLQICLTTLLMTFTSYASALSDSSEASKMQTQKQAKLFETNAKYQLEKITDGLDHPWSLAWIDAETVIVSLRPGNFVLVNTATGKIDKVTGQPLVRAVGQGGMLDVITNLDNDQISKRNKSEPTKIWFCYSKPIGAASATTIASATLVGNRLLNSKDIFITNPPLTGGLHFGCRLAFGKDNKLYVTLGERGDRHNAQDFSNHPGSVLRINPDGSVPSDNPFVNKPNLAKREIFSYGHRNPQGLALNTVTGELWAHEHGPKGGDEINILSAGKNYGWPVVSYGEEYFGGKIGKGSDAPEFISPIHQWTPSIAPSGMAFYQGDKFPKWQNSLLVGALKYQQLRLLNIDYNKNPAGDIISQEIIVDGEIGRIRDVRIGPNGYIWLITDKSNGAIWKIKPM